MPLVPGNSRSAISSNISELTNHGSRPRPRKQIIAIALANARRTGGGVAAKPSFKKKRTSLFGPPKGGAFEE